MTVQPTETILIVDFGSQVTQLIARRVREAGVYSEIAPFNSAIDAYKRLKPKGIILSGGPASVTLAESPRAPSELFDAGVPMLGICYGQQFHPEVGHTPDGGKLIANFVRHVCGLSGDWTMAEFRATKIAEIREQVGTAKVICGLSGGVDSAVAAVLIHEAIGDQLTCVFVDHGLLRLAEGARVVELFRGHYNIPLVHVDAAAQFLGALSGVSDPEQKRKTIGKL